MEMYGRVSLLLLLLVVLQMVPSSLSRLDPKELSALKSMNIIPLNGGGDPCTSKSNVCDADNHLVSLRATNCSHKVSLSNTAFQSLSFLTDLHFIDCPAHIVRLPPDITSNINSLTSINSLKDLTGVWLSRLSNLVSLTISGTPITASGPSIILNSLNHLTNLTISSTNLTGYLPKSFTTPNITHLDLSLNKLQGQLPTSIGDDLSHLNYLSLSSNSLSGPIPQSLGSISTLAHLDLSSNQFNGTIPDFLADIKGLKYLNLENNNFHGVMPFSHSFINRLDLFKVGGNANLCYNKTSISSSKIKLGISPCDKNGFPITQEANSPAPMEDSGDGADQTSSGDETSDIAGGAGGSHGPNKVVLGVAIALSCIVLLIIFLIILAKRCT